MPDLYPAGTCRGDDTSKASNDLAELLGARATTCDGICDLLQLCPGNGAGQLAHAVVLRQKEEAAGAKRCQSRGHALSEKRSARCAHASFEVTIRPPSPQLMCLLCCRLKQPMSPMAPTRCPVVFRPVSLRAILDQHNAVLAADAAQLVHRAGHAGKMYSDDGRVRGVMTLSTEAGSSTMVCGRHLRRQGWRSARVSGGWTQYP